MRVKIVESNVCVSADDAEERKSQLEDELMKNGKVTRLIRLHHLLQDDGQLRRWRELSPKLATTVDGKLFPYYVTAALKIRGDFEVFTPQGQHAALKRVKFGVEESTPYRCMDETESFTNFFTKSDHHHHFICPIIQHYAHVHQYNLEEQDKVPQEH